MYLEASTQHIGTGGELEILERVLPLWGFFLCSLLLLNHHTVTLVPFQIDRNRAHKAPRGPFSLAVVPVRIYPAEKLLLLNGARRHQVMLVSIPHESPKPPGSLDAVCKLGWRGIYCDTQGSRSLCTGQLSIHHCHECCPPTATAWSRIVSVLGVKSAPLSEGVTVRFLDLLSST